MLAWNVPHAASHLSVSNLLWFCCAEGRRNSFSIAKHRYMFIISKKPLGTPKNLHPAAGFVPRALLFPKKCRRGQALWIGKAASAEQAVQCFEPGLGQAWVWAASPQCPRPRGERGVHGGEMELLPAQVGGTAAKVPVSGGKGTPISFAAANGNQTAASTFDVQKTPTA